MNKRDLLRDDISNHEAVRLDRVLKKDTASTEKLVSVEEALTQKPVAAKADSRSTARVLFISQDTTLLNPSTQSLDGYLQLKDLFDEVHVLILRTGIPAKYPVLRVEEGVWLYTASGKAWWQLPNKGESLVEQELVFANGFRPDLIVARDPFESALVGKRLAEKFNKPLQIHVLTKYSGERTRYSATQNIFRRFLPRITLPAAVSVRADTEAVLAELKKQYDSPDSALLPTYQAYEQIITATPTFSLADKYRPHSFFFLYVGRLDKNSAAFRVIDAVRHALKNPTMALIILGDGPAKSEFQKRARLLGIADKVIFESRVPDIVSYFKGADILITPETSEASDEILLKGAAAGLPAAMAATESREDYFGSTESGLLCPADDTTALTKCVEELISNANLRKHRGEAAQEMVKRRFHNSLHDYQQAFRESIEQTLLVDVEPKEKVE